MAVSIALIAAESSVYFREQFEDGGEFEKFVFWCFLYIIYTLCGVRACDGFTIDLKFYAVESPYAIAMAWQQWWIVFIKL